jgi:hypothetical protein
VTETDDRQERLRRLWEERAERFGAKIVDADGNERPYVLPHSLGGRHPSAGISARKWTSTLIPRRP